jgi:hypothetical protein
LGNLAPDLFLSFIVRRHEYAPTAALVKKRMRRLYEGHFYRRPALFSFYLGTISHYICDYFCYSHHPSFPGSFWEHIVYEARQKTGAEDEKNTPGQTKADMSFLELSGMLEERLLCHGRTRGESRVQEDIPAAVNTAVDLNAVICFSAASKSSVPEYVSPERMTPLSPAWGSSLA